MPGNQSKNMPISPPLDRLRTGISRVRWCDPDNGRYTYQPAVMKEVMYSKEADSATEMSWFDELFHGGIVLPRQKGNRSRAVTLLITGPPGTGKSTLALELCVRLAMRGSQKPIEGKTLYVAYEAHPEWMIDNARSFGWLGQARKEVPNGDGSMRKEEDGEVVARLFNLGTKPSGAPISIRTPEEIEAGIGGFYRDLQALLGVTAPRAPLSEKEKDASSFDIVVIDSLNTVERGKEKKFAEHYKRFVEAGPKLIVFVLDSSPIIPVAETWEFAADIVVRLDRKYDSEYMIRTLEIVKARYQAHVWGKQQLKIEVAPETMPDKQVGASTENARIAAHTLNGLSEAEREERVRAHPWGEGGIFIFPSIHYILSRYKRRAPLELSKSNEGASTSSGRKPVPTPIESLNELLGGGIPAGRTTALWGERGTHKSHLGHMQVLHNVLDWNARHCPRAR